MQRLYEWIKALLQEKVNIFIKGLFGGSFVLGILLYRIPIGAATFTALVLAYLLKLFALIVGGIASGYAAVIGNDLAAWTKEKWKKTMVKRKHKIHKKKAA